MKRRKGLWGVVFCVCLLAGLTACSSNKADQPTEDSKAGAFRKGTYTGVSKNGKNGELKVEVELSENEIISVVVKEHQETKGLTDTALERIPSQVVEYQSLQIDAVSGATITCDAILEAVADCIVQAGGDVEALKNKAVMKDSNTEVMEKTVDVVIIGAGATGMAAAVSSAERGADSVIVLEKTASIGGNAIVSGGYLEYISAPEELRPANTEGYDQIVKNLIEAEPLSELHAEYQKVLKEEYEAYKASGSNKIFDSRHLLALDYYQLEPYSDPDSMYGFATLLDETTDWFTQMGMKWKPLTGIVGYTWPRWTSPLEGYEGNGYFDLFDQIINQEKYPIEIMLETAGTELIMEDNRVVGVKAKNADGQEYRLYGKKGVVLATGGFAANPEMLMEYNTNWDKLSLDTPTTNKSGCTGDGIRMAEVLGAKLEAMDDIMLFPVADPYSFSTENIVGNDGDALFVNKEGKRFVDETMDRYTISGALLEQTDKIMYLISDNGNCQIKNGQTFNGFEVEKMLESGQLYRADTLEELAGLLGIEADTFVSTVNAYNDAAANFKDEEFGRISFSEESAIDEAPFYALPRTAASHITMGGIVRDDQFRVLDTNDKAIEGLYAGGEVTAYMSGISSFGDGMNIGRIIFGK